MARKQTTSVTFEIDFDLPAGSSIEKLIAVINEVLDQSELISGKPKLIKKETTYE